MKLIILTILSAVGLSLSSFAVDYDGGLQVTLLHALDNAQPEQFTFRGNLSVNLARGANIAQEPLSSVDRQNLKSLAENDKFYRLKSVVTYNDGSTASFLTFSKAVSGRDGKINSINYLPDLISVRSGQVPAQRQHLDIDRQ